jgi:hypothetical protein
MFYEMEVEDFCYDKVFGVDSVSLRLPHTSCALHKPTPRPLRVPTQRVHFARIVTQEGGPLIEGNQRQRTSASETTNKN